MGLEETKRELIFSREIPKTLCWWAVLGAIVVIAVVVAGHSPRVLNAWAHQLEAAARQTEDVTGNLASASSRIDKIAEKIEAKVDPILATVASAATHFDNAAGSIETQLPSLVADLRSDINALSKEGTGLVADIRKDNPATSVKSLIDDAKPHVVIATQKLETGMTSLADAAQVLDDSMKDPKVKEFVDEAMKHADSVLVNFDTASGNVSLATADAKKVTTNLIGISADFNAMTADSSLKLHQVLFPERAKGFWPRTGQILSFIYKPVFEGLGIYYRLQSLPVRITQPIPILK